MILCESIQVQKIRMHRFLCTSIQIIQMPYCHLHAGKCFIIYARGMICVSCLFTACGEFNTEQLHFQKTRKDILETKILQLKLKKNKQIFDKFFDFYLHNF